MRLPVLAAAVAESSRFRVICQSPDQLFEQAHPYSPHSTATHLQAFLLAVALSGVHAQIVCAALAKPQVRQCDAVCRSAAMTSTCGDTSKRSSEASAAVTACVRAEQLQGCHIPDLKGKLRNIVMTHKRRFHVQSWIEQHALRDRCGTGHAQTASPLRVVLLRLSISPAIDRSNRPAV